MCSPVSSCSRVPVPTVRRRPSPLTPLPHGSLRSSVSPLSHGHLPTVPRVRPFPSFSRLHPVLTHGPTLNSPSSTRCFLRPVGSRPLPPPPVSFRPDSRYTTTRTTTTTTDTSSQTLSVRVARMNVATGHTASVSRTVTKPPTATASLPAPRLVPRSRTITTVPTAGPVPHTVPPVDAMRTTAFAAKKDNQNHETGNIDDQKAADTNDDKALRLYDYQRVGVEWMKHRETQSNPCGGILADEMGLGKTPQAIAVIRDAWRRHCRFYSTTPATTGPSHVSSS